MTDRMNNNLAALLTPPPSHAVQFSQGIVKQWDRTAFSNEIEWRGITLTDIPMVEGVNPLAIKEGDIVGMLGWAPENAKGVGSWWIIGKLSNPGEKVSDLTFYLGQIRFMTDSVLTGEGPYLQAYFGSSTDGFPLTRLYYGDEGNTPALSISGKDSIRIRDPENHIIFENDSGTNVGLARPYLHYHMAPTTNAMIEGTVFVPSTRSAAYVDIYEGNHHAWHPNVSYDVGISATGVTDWRIVVNGTVVFNGSPSATGDFAIPGWGTTVTPGAIVNFVIQARNTGAGFTRVILRRFSGRQS
jgi:hypothetical protein